MTQDCHILWSMIDPNMRSILIHNDIKPPMQLIFDMPMGSYSLRELSDLSRAATDEIACFSFNMCAYLPFRFEHTDTLQSSPRCTAREA